MKVIINQPVTIDQLREKIAQQFPNYKCTMRNKQMLVVSKSSTAAAIVMVRSGKVIVNEAFATIGGQMLFTLCCVLLGFLIPLIIYFAAFFPAQKAVRTEIAEYVRSQYGGGGQ